MMTRDQLMAAFDRYGGDLSRWPRSDREEAQALIASDTRAASDWETARRLDGFLSELTAPVNVDAALIGRIVSGQPKGEIVLQATPRLAGWASAAVAATLMLGFVAGVLLPVDQSNDAIAELLFSGDEESFGGELL